MLKIVSSTILCVGLASCTSSSKKVNLTSSETSEVFSLNLEEESSQWKKVGETPVEVAMEGNNLELYKIQNKDKKNQFVLMPSKIPEGVLNIDFELLERQVQDSEAPSTSPRMDQINDATASVIRAYAALWKKEPDTSIELAKQAEQIAAGLIGPPIVQALAALMKNDLEQAKAMLEIAKTRPKTNTTIIEEIEKRIEQSN